MRETYPRCPHREGAPPIGFSFDFFSPWVKTESVRPVPRRAPPAPQPPPANGEVPTPGSGPGRDNMRAVAKNGFGRFLLTGDEERGGNVNEVQRVVVAFWFCVRPGPGGPADRTAFQPTGVRAVEGGQYVGGWVGAVVGDRMSKGCFFFFVAASYDGISLGEGSRFIEIGRTTQMFPKHTPVAVQPRFSSFEL